MMEPRRTLKHHMSTAMRALPTELVAQVPGDALRGAATGLIVSPDTESAADYARRGAIVGALTGLVGTAGNSALTAQRDHLLARKNSARSAQGWRAPDTRAQRIDALIDPAIRRNAQALATLSIVPVLSSAAAARWGGGTDRPQDTSVVAPGEKSASYNAGAAHVLQRLAVTKTARASNATATAPDFGDRATDAAIGAASLGVGGKMLHPAVERLVGAQRFLHGTSAAAAKSILEQGLLREHGGSVAGGAAAIGVPAYVDNSKGRIHVAPDTWTGQRLGAAHARMLGDIAAGVDDVPPEFSYMKGMTTGNPGHGEIVGGAMPYDDFHSLFEVDPDSPGAFRTDRADIAPEQLRRGRASIGDTLRGRTKDLGAYVRAHPKRFATGAGLLTTGTLAGAYGASKIHDAVKTSAVLRQIWRTSAV